MIVVDDELLITPCCGTEIKPAAGFQSVMCCGEEFLINELEPADEET